MSKKKHREQEVQGSQGSLVGTSEYAVIFSDLARVILLNVLYLGLILALYYYNNKTGFLERYVANLLNW